MEKDSLYQMIFKRKSFHIFRRKNFIYEKEQPLLSKEELAFIKDKMQHLKPLYENIKTEIKLVKTNETTCNRGGEYCIMFYSEPKDNYLQNIGYLGEQLDLYLPQMNIGVLWFGIGKEKVKANNGLQFVIMMNISKMNEEDFRKDMFKSKRKEIAETWIGTHYTNISNIVRFAPSACNSQPWLTEEVDKNLFVYRYKKPGKRGIMPVKKVGFYNRIDIGIYLLFLELCLDESKITYTRELFIDNEETTEEDAIKTLVAKYTIQ